MKSETVDLLSKKRRSRVVVDNEVKTLDLINSKPIRKKNLEVLDLCGHGDIKIRKDTAKKHFMKRFHERCGVCIKHYQYDQILELAENTEIHKRTKNPSRTIRIVNYGGFNLHVVYDETLKRIVTVLPPHKKIYIDNEDIS